jgi:hypothetical protein
MPFIAIYKAPAALALTMTERSCGLLKLAMVGSKILELRKIKYALRGGAVLNGAAGYPKLSKS